MRRKNCVYSASIRCEKYRDVAAALGEVASLFRSEKVRAWRRDHAKFAQKFRERIAKLPEFRHAARRKKCVHSASVRCTTLATSLQLSVKSKGCSNPKKVRVRRRDHAKPAQKFSRKNCKISGILARHARTEFVHLGQHALRKPYDVTETLDQVHGAFRSEKAGARRRDHANFVRKSRERIVKFPEFRRALRRNNCMYSASDRCKKYLNVAIALFYV